MSRLRALTDDELDPEQGELSEALKAGGLVDQFGAYLRAPELGSKLMSLGGWFRSGAILDRRLAELAICIVSARTKSDFAFWRHGPMAVDDGVDAGTIEDIRKGKTPTFSRQDERLVYEVATQLLSNNRVDQGTYETAVSVLEEREMFELIAVIGFYGLMGMILNVFEVEVPGGESVFPEGRMNHGLEGGET